MQKPLTESIETTASSRWLQKYYFTRAIVASIWVALAFTVGRDNFMIASILLILYPAWDAFANWIDARRSGGLKQNKSQALNVVISILTTIAIACTLGIGMKPVLIVYGMWAFLSGVFQLATGIRRWKNYGAQWVMILSGGQSALVSIHFFLKAMSVPIPGIEVVAPYASLGAFYFLLSAILLTIKFYRSKR